MSGSESVSSIVGIIGKPHGINGYVFVRMFTDYPDTVIDSNIYYLDEICSAKIEIEEVKNIIVRGNKRTIIKFVSIKNRSDAESLRGSMLYRKTLDRPEIKEGDYWIDELVGCEVYIKGKGSYVGKVIEVEKYHSNDNLIVEYRTLKDKTSKFIIIPMLEDYIEKINVQHKKIYLHQLPEYI